MLSEMDKLSGNLRSQAGKQARKAGETMNMKTEIWNGNEIRFVEKEAGEWWAVAVDVCKALAIKNVTNALRKIKPTNRMIYTLPNVKGTINNEINVINEKAIYQIVFKSHKPEAEAFQDWVYEMLKTLRQTSGLESFQVFRMLDKEHQKEAMKRLHAGLITSVRIDYIKANIIANKAISTRHGYPKAVKKKDMPAEWLPERQPILDDTVDLMALNERLGLDLSISDVIYKKYCSW